VARSRLTSTARAGAGAPRILIILPCCIGDVVMATAALGALRRAYPAAHITFAVGGWARAVLEAHPAVDALLDTGPGDLPLRNAREAWRFIRSMRRGRYDIVVSLVRSRMMSAAVRVSGIRQRAGIDSAGRGFGYTLRAPVDPREPRHEAAIYLSVVRLLGVDTADCWVNLPVDPDLRAAMARPDSPILIHPGGGRNPGMTMDSKRWPPAHFAHVADALAAQTGAPIVLVGGPGDEPIVAAVAAAMQAPAEQHVGDLTIPQIGALAATARLYLGNDTGLTHVAAASGARTVMIMGPSDPLRYAPWVPDALVLWKPTQLAVGGVASGPAAGWDWERDGVSVAEALARIEAYLAAVPR
jgi:heptosyltransferase II